MITEQSLCGSKKRQTSWSLQALLKFKIRALKNFPTFLSLLTVVCRDQLRISSLQISGISASLSLNWRILSCRTFCYVFVQGISFLGQCLNERVQHFVDCALSGGQPTHEIGLFETEFERRTSVFARPLWRPWTAPARGSVVWRARRSPVRGFNRANAMNHILKISGPQNHSSDELSFPVILSRNLTIEIQSTEWHWETRFETTVEAFEKIQHFLS